MAAATPKSLRDAFIRIQHNPPFSKFKIILAEEFNGFFYRGSYTDILSFEADLAQISQLIMLFSESFGSAAELGAFSMVKEIASRLLIIIDDKNYIEDSFIKFGPIRSLEVLYGPSSICVLNHRDLNISDIASLSSIDLKAFEERLRDAVLERAKKFPEPTTFDHTRNGHLIKLIVGFIQHYGALTIDEINVIMYCLDIPKSEKEIFDFLLCAKSVGWISEEKRGIYTYYSSIVDRPAMYYKLKPGSPRIDKIRWIADIREYWKSHDKNRFNSMISAVGIASA